MFIRESLLEVEGNRPFLKEPNQLIVSTSVVKQKIKNSILLSLKESLRDNKIIFLLKY